MYFVAVYRGCWVCVSGFEKDVSNSLASMCYKQSSQLSKCWNKLWGWLQQGLPSLRRNSIPTHRRDTHSRILRAADTIFTISNSYPSAIASETIYLRFLDPNPRFYRQKLFDRNHSALRRSFRNSQINRWRNVRGQRHLSLFLDVPIELWERITFQWQFPSCPVTDRNSAVAFPHANIRNESTVLIAPLEWNWIG